GIPEETFLWAVTKTDSRWIRSSLGRRGLRDAVAALRCGLDPSSWAGDGETSCRNLALTNFSREDAEVGKLLPFDLSRAHSLYKSLFGQIEDLIKDRHLLIV